MRKRVRGFRAFTVQETAIWQNLVSVPTHHLTLNLANGIISNKVLGGASQTRKGGEGSWQGSIPDNSHETC